MKEELQTVKKEINDNKKSITTELTKLKDTTQSLGFRINSLSHDVGEANQERINMKKELNNRIRKLEFENNELKIQGMKIFNQ